MIFACRVSRCFYRHFSRHLLVNSIFRSTSHLPQTRIILYCKRSLCGDAQNNASKLSLIEQSRGGGALSYFPYILLNEIQTMFSQLAKRSAKVLPADLCSDHAHYVKIHGSTVLRRSENMAVEGGTVSHDYILVISQIY